MPQISVSRAIAADPVSTTLLLTGLDALAHWPGLSVTGRQGDAILAQVTHGGTTSEVVLRVLPPRRTTAAFVTDFTATGGEFGDTRGTLTLSYRPGGTEARMELSSAAEALTVPAQRFLGSLAHAAEQRSSAA